MPRRLKLRVVFYCNERGREPTREWLRSLDRDSKKVIGEDIKTVQYGWPLGMPLVGNLGDGLWEVRSQLKDGIARVVFLAEGDLMVVLHGFVKKSQKAPRNELKTARRRAAQLRGDKG